MQRVHYLTRTKRGAAEAGSSDKGPQNWMSRTPCSQGVSNGVILSRRLQPLRVDAPSGDHREVAVFYRGGWLRFGLA